MDVWQSFVQKKSGSVKRDMKFVGEPVILREQAPEGEDEC